MRGSCTTRNTAVDGLRLGGMTAARAAALGTDPEQLTNSMGENWEPVASGNGDRITFVSNSDGTFDVYVMNIDGSNPQQLTTTPTDEWETSWPGR